MPVSWQVVTESGGARILWIFAVVRRKGGEAVVLGVVVGLVVGISRVVDCSFFPRVTDD